MSEGRVNVAVGRWGRLVAEFTAPLAWALMLSVAFLVFVTWDQSHWWSSKEDYSFGWLVPAFVAFVIYDRWPRIRAAVAACRTERSVCAQPVARNGCCGS